MQNKYDNDVNLELEQSSEVRTRGHTLRLNCQMLLWVKKVFLVLQW